MRSSATSCIWTKRPRPNSANPGNDLAVKQDVRGHALEPGTRSPPATLVNTGARTWDLRAIRNDLTVVPNFQVLCPNEQRSR
jgi:hypothetical protein